MRNLKSRNSAVRDSEKCVPLDIRPTCNAYCSRSLTSSSSLDGRALATPSRMLDIISKFFSRRFVIVS